MKFIYEYRTSDNVRHEDVVVASNRDAAFAALKQRGIRPGRLVEAPGFFNKLFGKGKRWIAIGILAAMCLALGVTVLLAPDAESQASDVTSPMPRHQIYGDPALMDELERTGFATVFESAGERVLAHYAQPGRFFRRARFDAADLAACLTNEVSFLADEPREQIEIKRIVLWHKDELATYLASGTGTVETYLARLEERQIAEAKIYEDVKKELSTERDFDVWEQKNENLRNLGLRTIPLPSGDEAREKN